MGAVADGATLHALHYHHVDVQAELKKVDLASERDQLTNDLLTIPVAPERNWSAATIQQELDNNCQGTSVMWCVGSSRASVARKCRISTMWV